MNREMVVAHPQDNSQLKDKLRKVARKGIALCFVQMDG